MRMGSTEAVVVAVQEDAAAEVERIERDVATAVARLRAEDAALPVVVADAETRVAAARRAVRDRVAAEDWADRLAVLNNRETWIERVIAEGERRLGALDLSILRADLVDLVGEAIGRMPDGPLELLVPAGDRELVEAMLGEGTLTPPGKVVTGVKATSEITSGCIVQTADGRIRYENSYSTRARRLETAWRARLGALYEEPAEPARSGSSAQRSVA